MSGAGNIHLPKIDTASLVDFYNSGGTIDMTVPDERVCIKKGLSALAKDDIADDRFIIRDSRDAPHQFHASGGVLFRKFESHEELTPVHFRCLTCSIITKDIPIGIPVKHTVEGGKDVYYMVNLNFHSFECALKFIVDHHSRRECRQDPRYAPSHHLLKSLFRKMYGMSKELVEINDQEILKHNGGTLSREEDQSHRLIPTSDMLIPCKSIYMMNNLG